MNAKVKATEEIVEAELKGFDNLNVAHYIINGNQNWILSEFSLEFLESDLKPDYWSRLEHTYAGMAMQGMLNNSLLITGLLKVNKSHEDIVAEVTGTAIRYAHALVEKLQEKEGK